MKSDNMSTGDSTPDRLEVTPMDQVNLRSCNLGSESTDTERDGATEPKELPEDILEMIVSRLPFQSLFEARFLSKTWYSKFPARVDDAMKLHSTSLQLPLSSFQKQILSMSSNWPTYCPVFVTTGTRTLVGFDQTSSEWKVVMKPVDLIPVSSKPICCAGALMLLCSSEEPISGGEFTVVNVLTKSKRDLTSGVGEEVIPKARGKHHFFVFRLVPTGSNAFNLILMFRQRRKCGYRAPTFIRVYDSVTQEWSSTMLISGVDPGPNLSYASYFGNAAYADWTFYGVVGNSPRNSSEMTIWTYNVREKTWSSKVIIHDETEWNSFRVASLLFCAGKLMLCVCSSQSMISIPVMVGIGVPHVSNMTTRSYGILVYELDAESLQPNRCLRGPPEDILGKADNTCEGHNNMQVVSHGDRIYFGRNSLGFPVLTLDVQTSGWSYLPVPSYLMDTRELTRTRWAGVLQPGLDPFCVV